MAPAIASSENDLLSPAASLSQLVPRAATPNDPNHTYRPGAGVRPPDAFNNKAYFALFAILGAVMVVVSIWFFFWAKNGGFTWERNDWDDYKTTVLRRKGKDGKTLSNATPHTDLGEKSIAGTFDVERDTVAGNDFYHNQRRGDRKSSRPHRNHDREPSGGDDDLRAYRKERAARVGGLNRQEDGSHFDYSNGSRSDLGSNISSRPLHPKPREPTKQEKKAEKKEAKKEEKQKKKEEKMQKKEMKKRQSAGPFPSRPRHVFAADEASVMGASSIDPGSSASQAGATRDNYFSAYRPPAPPNAPSRRYEQRKSAQYTPHPAQRQHSPTKPAAAAQRRHHPGSFDAYSDAGSSDTGTKVYSHHIPQLSRGSRDTGFRRGGGVGGRRDSLSDSDDGDMAGFRR